MNPLVSVITPNHNGARYIMRAVESVRCQNYNLEHIIVDDCSSDESLFLLNELSTKYSWLKVVRLKENVGPAIARNCAIDVSSGRYLAFLDIDDFWLPNKLKTQIEFMKYNDCAMSFTDYRVVNSNGSKIGLRIKGFNSINWQLHHMSRYICNSSVIIDREKCFNFRFPVMPYRAEDFLAWSNCIRQHGYALRCPYDLTRYSKVPGSVSSNIIRNCSSIFKIYTDLEKIPASTAFIYFVFYALAASWKRIFYRPIMDSKKVDGAFFDVLVNYRLTPE